MLLRLCSSSSAPGTDELESRGPFTGPEAAALWRGFSILSTHPRPFRLPMPRGAQVTGSFAQVRYSVLHRFICRRNRSAGPTPPHLAVAADLSSESAKVRDGDPQRAFRADPEARHPGDVSRVGHFLQPGDDP